MPFCYCPRSSILEMVSSSRGKTTREEVDLVTIRGQEEERDYGGEVHKNKRPLNPAHISPKNEKQLETRTSLKNNSNVPI
jgi:hypothetical protein